MSLQESAQARAREMLLKNPNPRAISRGALLTLLKAVVTPAGRFPSKSQKRLFVAAYNHGRRFFAGGGRAVFTSLFSPVELIHAFDMIPFPVEPLGALAASFGIAPDLLSAADQAWLSPDYCTFHRAFVGAARLGLLPEPRFLFAVSHVCDGTMKSFSEVNERLDRPFIFINTPFGRDEASSAYLAGQIESAVSDIERATGRKLRMDRLERAFHYANRMQRALEGLGKLRRGDTPILSGSEGIQLILTWGMLSGSRVGARMCEGYLKDAQERVRRGVPPSGKGKRILWLHLEPFYPNRLLSMLEDLGGDVVVEEINTVPDRLLDISRPWESMAEKMLTQAWIGEIDRRLNNITRLVEDYRIDGVIHFSHWGCRQSNGAVRLIRDRVTDLGVPFLELDGDCIDPRSFSEEQARTRLEGFMEIMH
jgi:benzoyl-CoA reductase/2-hydroxyglutaryl-CoA dehydratase subunit BcrC/BadD/HgdB